MIFPNASTRDFIWAPPTRRHHNNGQNHPTHLLVGRIVAMDVHVDDGVMHDGYIDPVRLKALGRLG